MPSVLLLFLSYCKSYPILSNRKSPILNLVVQLDIRNRIFALSVFLLPLSYRKSIRQYFSPMAAWPLHRRALIGGDRLPEALIGGGAAQISSQLVHEKTRPCGLLGEEEKEKWKKERGRERWRGY